MVPNCESWATRQDDNPFGALHVHGIFPEFWTDVMFDHLENESVSQ